MRIAFFASTCHQMESALYAALYIWSIQPKVSIRVDGATEFGTKISQIEEAAANVRVMPALKIVADWPPKRLYSVAHRPESRPLAELTIEAAHSRTQPTLSMLAFSTPCVIYRCQA